jgi:hypothetical protein
MGDIHHQRPHSLSSTILLQSTSSPWNINNFQPREAEDSVRNKSKFAVAILVAMLAGTSHAWGVILPDACGKDEIQFDVKTLKGDSAPAPDATKAEIVFIESTQHGSQTVRYGLDGAWAGANKGNSYFTVWVTPGEHHLCASWQSMFKKAVNNYTGMTSLTAEAGKVYYIEYKIAMTGDGGGMGTVVGGSSAGQPVMTAPSFSVSTNFALVTEDEGKYRMKVSPISTSNIQK